MNLQETLELVQALKLAGATHFKSNDFEITLDNSVQVKEEWVVNKPKPEVPLTPEQTKATEVANEKIKSMISTLQMTPEQLADQIFPNGAL